MKKIIKKTSFFLLLTLPNIIFAQGDINGAINTGTNNLKTIAGNVVSFITVVMAIAGIAAVAYVFFKMAKGDQDAWNKAQNWIVALIFAVVSLIVIKQLWL